MCSNHFEKGIAYPTVNLGYDAHENIKKLLPNERTRKIRRLHFQEGVASTSSSDKIANFVVTSNNESANFTVVDMNQKVL